DGVGHRGGEPPERVEPSWRFNPSRGADLASFVAPGPSRPEEGALIRMHPAYLGFSALLLALLAGRRGGAWWVILALALALAPGTTLRFAGESTGLPNPVVHLARQ